MESPCDLVPQLLLSCFPHSSSYTKGPVAFVHLWFPKHPVCFHTCSPLLVPFYLPGMPYFTDSLPKHALSFQAPLSYHQLSGCLPLSFPRTMCPIGWDTFIFLTCILSTYLVAAGMVKWTRQVWYGEDQMVTQVTTRCHLSMWIYRDSGPDFQPECLGTWPNKLRSGSISQR